MAGECSAAIGKAFRRSGNAPQSSGSIPQGHRGRLDGCGVLRSGRGAVRKRRGIAGRHGETLPNDPGMIRSGREMFPLVSLVPQLHCGTGLSAKFHFGEGASNLQAAPPTRTSGQWNCQDRCVPQWSCGTRAQKSPREWRAKLREKNGLKGGAAYCGVAALRRCGVAALRRCGVAALLGSGGALFFIQVRNVLLKRVKQSQSRN
jgi:hypothetical protein